jgi:HEAT repeat protein
MEMKKIMSEIPVSSLEIQLWIDELGSAIGSERLKARLSLIREGTPAVPALIKLLRGGNAHARWEAAVALETIRDPSAASALVCALEDDDHDVRWAAMKALIALDRVGLESLLRALMQDFDSVWLREGARHILHELKKQRQLRQPSLGVLQALDGLEPGVAVPLAAEAAWEKLFGPGKERSA